MTTDLEIDPSLTTPSEEPPSSETTQPSKEEPPETVEELRAKLAAAETEKNRWKGRVEKANEKKAKTTASPADLDELEWKLENKDRINLVKDEYEKILADGYQGEKVSKKIALELAEKQMRIDPSDAKRKRQDDMSVPATSNRTAGEPVYVTPYDQALGLTAESKAKLLSEHPELARL